MVLNANEDMYATLDIAILDLYEGKIECVKNGACPTYIKRENAIEQINSNDLPAGILNNIALAIRFFGLLHAQEAGFVFYPFCFSQNG